ncbi:hypothetical protein M0R45_030796 [Rubus argutus]|uniref:Uncharacterized protein n=1 Tax=Rubus argutus TaxID=59490 RepID=A0AAW1WC70_RUBAR
MVGDAGATPAMEGDLGIGSTAAVMLDLVVFVIEQPRWVWIERTDLGIWVFRTERRRGVRLRRFGFVDLWIGFVGQSGGKVRR